MTDAVNIAMKLSPLLTLTVESTANVSGQLVKHLQAIDAVDVPFIQFDPMVKAFANGNLQWHDKDARKNMRVTIEPATSSPTARITNSVTSIPLSMGMKPPGSAFLQLGCHRFLAFDRSSCARTPGGVWGLAQSA